MMSMSIASTPTTPLPLELIMESPQTQEKHGRSPKPKALSQSLEGASPQSSTKEKNQKLRDNAVTMQLTKTKMCAFFERGKCASTNCRYAHSSSELRLPPNLQKTKLCRAFLASGCTDENCYFAHGETDLRVTEGIYKTQICNFFERGYCKKGDRCNHAHGNVDLRPAAAPLFVPTTPMGKTVSENHQGGDSTRSRRSPLPLSELLVVDSEANSGYDQRQMGYNMPPTPTKSITELAQMAFSPVHSSPLWSQYAAHPMSPMSALTPMGDMAPISMWQPRDAVDMLVHDQHMSPASNLMYTMDLMEPQMEMMEQHLANHTPDRAMQLLCLDSSPSHRPAPGLAAPFIASPPRSSPPPGFALGALGPQEPAQPAQPAAQGRDPLMVNLSERLASLDAVVSGLGSDIAAIKSDKKLHRI